MAETICCVCGRQAVKFIGPRGFCEEHYLTATHHRKGWQTAGLIQVAALVVFVVLVASLAQVLGVQFTPTSLLLVGVLLSLAPAALWLVFFYRQDLHEPEPKVMVARVFLLGALLAAALDRPLISGLFQTQDWLRSDALTHILGSILVVGFIQEFLKYAAVRYSVYDSVEYDERTDGVIYATAAGLGYATVLNVAFVIEGGGVALGAGVIRIVVTALAHASFAGVSGYFLGRAKFESEPIWWMPAGLTLAAVLNGVFFYVRDEVTRGSISVTGGAVNAWTGLALAAVLAAVTTLVVAWLVRRDLTAVLRRAE